MQAGLPGSAEMRKAERPGSRAASALSPKSWVPQVSILRPGNVQTLYAVNGGPRQTLAWPWLSLPATTRCRRLICRSGMFEMECAPGRRLRLRAWAPLVSELHETRELTLRFEEEGPQGPGKLPTPVLSGSGSRVFLSPTSWSTPVSIIRLEHSQPDFANFSLHRGAAALAARVQAPGAGQVRERPGQ